MHYQGSSQSALKSNYFRLSMILAIVLPCSWPSFTNRFLLMLPDRHRA